MPKHRKTRKQKLQAKMRQQTVTPTVAQLSLQKPIIPQQTTKAPEKFTLKPTEMQHNVTLINPHNYLQAELSKTALLSVCIIIGELLLYFLFRNHLIVLPALPY